MTVAADEANCDEEHCLLEGNAHITCDDFELWANTIDVEFDGDQRFSRATATGNVAAIDGNSVLTCERVELDGDRIRGRIKGATIELKERGGSLETLFASRNRSEIRGDVERTSERLFSVEDGEFTLCDCGDDPASWSFRASHVDVDLDNRAELYWSVLWITPEEVPIIGYPLQLLDQVAVPILPPIPYLSMPFARRAAGFLPPNIGFLNGFNPLIDLPFFIPLGESYDLTIAPGIRTDWVTEDGNALDEYGGPRLGVTFRYAPAEGTEGEVSFQYQRDAAARAAFFRAGAEEGEASPCDTNPDALECSFNNRLGIDFQHRSAITDAIDFNAGGQWFSDDLFLNDVGVNLVDLIQIYVASRAQLDYRSPWVYGAAALDFITRLQDGGDGNSRGAELGTFHRGPHLELRLPTVNVLPTVHVDVGATATRYGAWLTQLFSDEIGQLPEQWVYRGYASAGVYRTLGPVGFRARAMLDGIVSNVNAIDQAAEDRDFFAFDEQDRRALSLYTEASADLPLRGTFGRWQHVINPRVQFRSIPWDSNDLRFGERTSLSGALEPVAASVFDPYLQRDEFVQGALGFDQEFLLDGRRVATLELEQPVDLETGERLQFQGRLRVQPIPQVTATAHTQFAPGAEDPFREVGGSLGVRIWKLNVNSTYRRWFADSERFRRSVYQLSGAPAFVDNADPSRPGSEQQLTNGASLTLDTFSLGYSQQILLDLPGVEDLPGPDDDPNDSRLLFPFQTVSASYTSPCRCWGISVNVLLNRSFEDVENDVVELDQRIFFSFQIGDYALGGGG